MVIAAAFSLFAISCNKGGGDPKVVLTSFFDALQKKNIEEAKKHATKESVQMLDMMKMGFDQSTNDVKSDEYDKANLEFGEAKIDGDKATVPVKEKKSGESTNFTLKKEDGAWKVAFDKATMMEMAGEKMKEKGGTMPDFNKMGDSSELFQDSGKFMTPPVDTSN